jgi:hypothetical protein
MHRYDNQDRAMLSSMQSVARYFGETWTLGKGTRIVVITN